MNGCHPVPCRRTCDELNRVALAFEGLVVGRDKAGDLAAPPQRDVHLGEEPQLNGGKAREDRLVHLDAVPQQQAQVCNRRGIDKRQPTHEMGCRTSKNGRKRRDAMRLSGLTEFQPVLEGEEAGPQAGEPLNVLLSVRRPSGTQAVPVRHRGMSL